MAGRIVVGVDGSPSAAAAVEWAAADAALSGARLRIVHVREPWSYDFPLQAAPRFQGSLLAYWEAALAAAVEWVHRHAPGVEVSSALVTGAVSERLRAESEDADELVLGSRGLGGCTGLLFGSVGGSVAANAQGAVIVVRRPPPTRYGEVVVGFDGSEPSEAALGFAFRQARTRGARLRVVRAGRKPPFPGDATARAGDPLAVLAGVSPEAWQRLRSWRDRYPDVRMVASAVRGHPVPALVDASRRADLVVVGSRAREHGALGPVSRRVLRRARCPVAVVRPRPGSRDTVAGR
jgi:nucleotide-binding universal stress UspA family protein